MSTFMTNKFKFALLIITASSLSTISTAHTPYLLPNVFEPSDDGVVTLDASYGEYYFVPDRVFSDSQFEVTLPDGSAVVPEHLVEFKSRTVIEHTMEMEGTYRFSTGVRIGNITKSYELDGRTRRLQGADSEIPEGGNLLGIYQSKALAETYITRGVPTSLALNPAGAGLEFVMDSHPNELFLGERVTMHALLDGKPVAGVDVAVFLAARQAEGGTGTYAITSNEQGDLMFTPEEAGIYILKSRHSVPSPIGVDAPETRYTYTLVLEVTE